MRSKTQKRLIIVGGGFGGVTLAKEILKLAPEEFSVTLIDKNDYQIFYPALFKVVSTFAEPSVMFSVAAIKFKDIFSSKSEKKQINVLKKEVKDIRFDKNQVVLKGPIRGRNVLAYDYLVLAAGSEPDFVNVDVVKTCALTFKSFEDALKIKTEVEVVLKNKAKREDINITVIGGGFTGCALVAELFNYAHELAGIYGHPHQTIKFKLVAGKKILPFLSTWAQKRAQKSLEEMGIEVIIGSYVGSLGENGCILDNGTFVAADVLVWTGGVKPNSIVKVFPDDNKYFKNNRTYLKTTRTLAVRGYKNVFALGDNIYCPGSLYTGVPTAQSAIRQAKYVAKSLIRARKRKKARPYKPAKSIYVIELGKNFAFVDFGAIKLMGGLAKYVHRRGFMSYLKKILPLPEAVAWMEKYKSL